jgi:Flp pilus assembly pilin Flp
LEVTAVRIFRTLLCDLLRDETGAEVLEYALVLGLVIVVAISMIAQVGTKVAARWTSVNSGM